MNHAMIDLETFGNGSNGCIVSIGAVAFEPFSNTGYNAMRFKVNIKAGDAVKHGAVIDGDTVNWWMEQTEAARRALRDPVPLVEKIALNAFRNWYRETKCEAVWGHGSNFDNRLLREAYARYDERPPWHYRDDRDTRTLFDLVKHTTGADAPWPFNKNPHDALSDAETQAVAVQWAIQRLRAQKSFSVDYLPVTL